MEGFCQDITANICANTNIERFKQELFGAAMSEVVVNRLFQNSLLCRLGMLPVTFSVLLERIMSMLYPTVHPFTIYM